MPLFPRDRRRHLTKSLAGPTPSRDFRTTSLRSTRAPGAAPRVGAIRLATTDLPAPLRPPMATSWAGVGSNQRQGQREIVLARPVSMQLFDEDQSSELSVNGGIRILGGKTRELPKKNFVINFRSQYGMTPSGTRCSPRSIVSVSSRSCCGWVAMTGRATSLVCGTG